MALLIRSLLLFASLASICYSVDIATIDPCPQESGRIPSITVTSQYQTVSTCIPQTSASGTVYSYSSYQFVNTTVPIAPDGTSTTSVVVTDTAQWLTVTRYPEVTQSVAALVDRSNDYVTIQKQGLVKYKDCGHLIVPGWAGSGLCKVCDELAADGNYWQKIRMQECREHHSNRTCVEWDEWWYWTPVYQPPAILYPICSARQEVYSAGTYTWTFPQPGATSTFVEGGKTITATRDPWNAYVTKSCGGPTTFDFITTITKTVYVTAPHYTNKPTVTITIPYPPPSGWPQPGPGGPGGSGGTGGTFTTLTITPGATDVGSATITATIAQPTGTSPGTVIIIDPRLTPTGTGGATQTSAGPTGPFVTLTVTPTGSSGVTTTVTATVADPTGTAPGTVIIIAPTSGSSTNSGTSSAASSGSGSSTGSGISSTTSSFTGIVSADLTSTTTTPFGTITATGTNDPGSTTLITVTQGSSTVVVPCIGVLCASVSATITGGPGVGVTITVLPTPTTTITLGPITATGPNDPGSTTDITVTQGSSAVVVPCVGVLCVSVSATLPIGDTGASITLLPTTGRTTITLGPITATLPNDPLSTTSLTVTQGNSIGVIPCVGLLCAEVSATLPFGGAGASITLLPTPVLTTILGPITRLGPNDPGSTTSITVTQGSSAIVVPCVGLLCVSASATLPIGNTGVDVTLLPNPGRTTTAATIIATGVNDPGSTTQITVTQGSSVIVVPCVGLLCAQVSATLPIVGNVGASVTVLPTPVTTETASTIIATGANDPGATTQITVTQGSSVVVVPCVGLLCAQVSATLPVVGNVGASLTVLPGDNGGNTAIQPTTTPAAVGGGGGAGTGTTTTPCAGALCASVSASLPIVGGAGVDATVLPNPTTTPAVAATTPAAAATTPRAATTTPCVGALCVNLGLTLKKRGEAEPTAVPTTLVKHPAYRSSELILAQPTLPETCSLTVNICSGLDMNTLFHTQPCVSYHRLGCLLTNTLNGARDRCTSSECDTYGVTGDGLLSLTSDLTITDIQARVKAYAQAYGGVCNAGQTVRLFSNSPAC